MPRNDHGVSTPIIILIVAVLLAGVLAVLIVHQHRVAAPAASTAPAPPALSAEQRAYFSNLDFSDFHVSAAANFLGDTVTYLDGTVTNKGPKPVRRLEVQLNFVDTLNQVVLRETAHPLADHAAPLQPGETHTFRITFEHLPVDWNQAPPEVKPVYIKF